MSLMPVARQKLFFLTTVMLASVGSGGGGGGAGSAAPVVTFPRGRRPRSPVVATTHRDTDDDKEHEDASHAPGDDPRGPVPALARGHLDRRFPPPRRGLVNPGLGLGLRP